MKSENKGREKSGLMEMRKRGDEDRTKIARKKNDEEGGAGDLFGRSRDIDILQVIEKRVVNPPAMIGDKPGLLPAPNLLWG